MLNWARKHPWLSAFAGSATFLLLLFFGSLFVQVVREICTKNEYTNKPDCAYHHIGPFAILWVVEIIDSHNGFVTALATLVMAAFTGTLWFVTNKSVRVARGQFEFDRQAFRGSMEATVAQIELARDEFNATHRPKIIVHATSLPMDFSAHNPDDMCIGAFIQYFNIGASPAKIINIRARITRSRQPLQSGIFVHETAPIRTAFLESGMKDYVRLKSDYSLNFERTIQCAEDAIKGVPICMGTIRYEDGRGAIRETGFCYRLDAVGERWVSAEEPEYEYAY